MAAIIKKQNHKKTKQQTAHIHRTNIIKSYQLQCHTLTNHRLYFLFVGFSFVSFRHISGRSAGITWCVENCSASAAASI